MPTAAEGNARATSQAQNARTRAASQQTGEPTKNRNELVNNADLTVKTHEQAKNFLDKHRFMSKEDELSIEGLSFTLLSLAHSAPTKILQEGARAVAILLTEATAKSTGSEIMRYVEEKLAPIIDKVEEAMKSMKDMTEEANKSTEESRAIANRNREELLYGSQHSYADAIKNNLPSSHGNNIE